jgi:hypothetical protein
MFKGILIVGWTLIIGGTLLLVAFPRLGYLIPRPEYIRIFLLAFVPFSAIYGLVRLYRRVAKPSAPRT